MLDTLLVGTLVQSLISSRKQDEQFGEDVENTARRAIDRLVPPMIETYDSPFWRLLGLLIGLYAAHLSWTCNSALGRCVLLKVIMAMIAFLFSLIYLFLYWIFSSTACKAAIKSAKRRSK